MNHKKKQLKPQLGLAELFLQVGEQFPALLQAHHLSHPRTLCIPQTADAMNLKRHHQ